ncbi:MAG: M15 family metallopeptidase [Leptospira sp.]|nr:M15 family metallopeptidase [Leptospira sp.]
MRGLLFSSGFIFSILQGLLFQTLLFFFSSFPISADTLSGSLDTVKYLTGDYNKSEMLVKFENKIEKNIFFLRKDAANALEKMMEAYDIDRENISKQHIFISSAFRSFSDQKAIWEGKYKGDRKMRESVSGKTPEQIISLILEYSSAPGTSRHHWGTDFDLNVLKNDYYKKNGKGEFLYEWLRKNASRFGFCQPYNEYDQRGNKGYVEERWHWSYAPVANKLQTEWLRLYKEGKLNFKGKYTGSDYLKDLPPVYVSSINNACAKIK